MHTPLPLLAAILALVVNSSAQAQIRRCDIDGRVIFQSGPCPVDARLASAAPAAPVANNPSHKKSLADLLRERDGADHGRPAPPAFQGDGAAVLRARMGAV